VLFGQGFMPRRADPLAYALPAEEIENTLRTTRGSIASFAAAQPSYREFIAQMGQRTRS